MATLACHHGSMTSHDHEEDADLRRALEASLTDAAEYANRSQLSRDDGLQEGIAASLAAHEAQTRRQVQQENDQLARAQDESLQLAAAKQRESSTRRLLAEQADRRAVADAITASLNDNELDKVQSQLARFGRSAGEPEQSNGRRELPRLNTQPFRPPLPLALQAATGVSVQRRPSKPLPTPPKPSRPLTDDILPNVAIGLGRESASTYATPAYIRTRSAPERPAPCEDPFSDLHEAPLSRISTDSAGSDGTTSSAEQASSLRRHTSRLCSQEGVVTSPIPMAHPEGHDLVSSRRPILSSLTVPQQLSPNASTGVFSQSLPDFREVAHLGQSSAPAEEGPDSQPQSLARKPSFVDLEDCPTDVKIGFPAIDPDLLNGAAFPTPVELLCEPDIRLQTFCIEAKTYRTMVAYLMWHGQASIRADSPKLNHEATLSLEFYSGKIGTAPAIRLCITLISDQAMVINNVHHKPRFRTVSPATISLPITLVDLAKEMTNINKVAKESASRGFGPLHGLASEIEALSRANFEQPALEDKQEAARRNKNKLRRLKDRLKGRQDDPADTMTPDVSLPEAATFITPFQIQE